MAARRQWYASPKIFVSMSRPRSRFNASTAALLGQAMRAIVRNKTRSSLTMIGITIGIAAVVWVVAIGRAGSLRAEEQLLALGDNLVWVEAGSRTISGVRNGSHGTTSLTYEDALAIQREVPLIRRMSPQVDGTVLAASGTRNWTTRYRGVTRDYLPIKRFDLASGSTFSDDQIERADNVCLLGQTVKHQLFGSGDALGEVVRLSGQPFEIVGVLAPKGQSATGQDQDDTIMVPFSTAQKKLRGGKIAWLDDILCSAVSPEAVSPAIDQIVALMRQRHKIGPDDDDDFNIRRPEEIVKAQMEASDTFATLLISIACVSLLVGGIGIMNVMLASVAERTREIGVRLAVGATTGAVQLQFLAEAVFLSLFGGVLGVVVSIGGSSVIGRTIGWSLVIPLRAVLFAVVFSIVVGGVFGFFPARRASRMDPIAALRDE